AGAGNHQTAAEPEVQRDRCRDAVSLAIEYGEVRGLRTVPRRRLDARQHLAWRGAIEPDRDALTIGVILVSQALDRHRDEIRIAEMKSTVAVCAPHRLDDQVLARGGIDIREIEALENVERIDEHDAPRSWRRSGDDARTSILSHHGLALD